MPALYAQCLFVRAEFRSTSFSPVTAEKVRLLGFTYFSAVRHPETKKK